VTLSGYRIHGSNDTFNASTLRGMREDEIAIIGEAMVRHPVSANVERRAWRMVDARTAIRTVQVIGRRDFRSAFNMTVDSIRSRGLAAVVAGWWAFVWLPEVRALFTETTAGILRLSRRSNAA
jgi:hypothetical protein